MRRILKISGYIIGLLLLVVVIGVLYIMYGLAPEHPKPANTEALNWQREQKGNDFYTIKNGWLRKSSSGLWEEYLSGDAFTRGVIAGKLNKELLYTQEVAFVGQINKMIPSPVYLRFLGLFTRVFNRNLTANIPEEYLLEIYGESFSAPHEFDYIAKPYDRMLNYHSAHDIGHAMQNFALVGCTSFGAWGAKSADSSLIIGRNCDFYMGDEFAKDKIVLFCEPSTGNKFVMVTWAGMMGCLSGMNDKGVTVTINAAKSDMPTASADPIALLAREILQYATDINSANAIAKKRKTFVSESILIGSAADKRCAVIEKSPAHQALFYSDTNYLVCTNHYQSDTFSHDANNIENMERSASVYRYRRTQEMLGEQFPLNYLKTATILRNRNGLHGADIGVGNEKAINELICHHSVVFKPGELKIWISAGPYQEGAYVCYDLNKVFSKASNYKNDSGLDEAQLEVAPDTFLVSGEWQRFLNFRKDCEMIRNAINGKHPLDTDDNVFAKQMEATNPAYWETYFWLGEYFNFRKNKAKALVYYKRALALEINTVDEADKVKKRIAALSKN
jgi:predicted choloylglycine hydrolase